MARRGFNSNSTQKEEVEKEFELNFIQYKRQYKRQ